MATTAAVAAKKGMQTEQQNVAAFNELRQQQRMLASRISEIEMDIKEHDLVMEVLRGVEADRKCYRLVGGVLVERSVAVVLPGLQASSAKMKEFTGQLKTSLEAKGKELIQFREKHGLKINSGEPKEDKSTASAKPGDRQANILANV